MGQDKPINSFEEDEEYWHKNCMAKAFRVAVDRAIKNASHLPYIYLNQEDGYTYENNPSGEDKKLWFIGTRIRHGLAGSVISLFQSDVLE